MSTGNFKFEKKDGSWVQNDVWTAVDGYTMSHLHPFTKPNASALQHALDSSKAAGLPDISASPAQSKFMALQCRVLGVTHALEVGTLGGYSAIWLASENPQMKVTTIEYDAKHVEVARKNIAYAGLEDRIEILQGSALEVLGQLKKEIDEGKRPKFGFFFIDADKPNNLNYFNAAVEMALPKAMICVDNVVRGGRIVDENATDPKDTAGRVLVEGVAKDERVESVVMQTVGEKSYDGCLWAILKEQA
ncbi:O-methyltransferase-domain-containing protein [Sordaria brevicollis]|uniref:O-methyltransferase-domain-containing protein n=1 Tax=Sordaria brevicollis TaxID=83679 RepID=A0AAE0PME8_SORBR|nr:O-methyltransferase-domain-containing protein [Sordaria brevicollis]